MSRESREGAHLWQVIGRVYAEESADPSAADGWRRGSKAGDLLGRPQQEFLEALDRPAKIEAGGDAPETRA